MADKHQLWLIEDACEALGVKNNDQFVGTIGNFGTYSFYFSHHITTIEGGMLVTNCDHLADIARYMRAHGWVRHMHNANHHIAENPEIDPRFLFVSTGFNVRPTEINAVLGLSQLKKLTAFNQKRNQIKAIWDNVFQSLHRNGDLTLMNIAPKTNAALFGYPVLCRTKQSRIVFQQYLENQKIETRPIICGNLTRQPALKHHTYRIHENLINANAIMERGLYWGIHPRMTPEQIEYVSRTVLNFFKSNSGYRYENHVDFVNAE